MYNIVCSITILIQTDTFVKYFQYELNQEVIFLCCPKLVTWYTGYCFTVQKGFVYLVCIEQTIITISPKCYKAIALWKWTVSENILLIARNR